MNIHFFKAERSISRWGWGSPISWTIAAIEPVYQYPRLTTTLVSFREETVARRWGWDGGVTNCSRGNQLRSPWRRWRLPWPGCPASNRPRPRSRREWTISETAGTRTGTCSRPGIPRRRTSEIIIDTSTIQVRVRANRIANRCVKASLLTRARTRSRRRGRRREKKGKEEISLSLTRFSNRSRSRQMRDESPSCAGEFRYQRIGRQKREAHTVRFRVIARGRESARDRVSSGEEYLSPVASVPAWIFYFVFGVERLSKISRRSRREIIRSHFSALRQFGLSSSLMFHCARSRHIRLRTGAGSPDSLVSTIYSERTAATRPDKSGATIARRQCTPRYRSAKGRRLIFSKLIFPESLQREEKEIRLTDSKFRTCENILRRAPARRKIARVTLSLAPKSY